MFKGQLHYKTLVEGQLWQLDAPLIYEWTQKDYHQCYIKEHRIIIPKGYVTDFYTIPKWAQKIWPKDLDPKHPAVLHDYLYTNYFMQLPRLKADQLFLHAMKQMDVPWLQRSLFYKAVRFGGKGMWKSRVQRRIQFLKSLNIECHTNGQPICPLRNS